MAARPTWQGHLKLSLVTCPVALYTATASNAHVSFHLINPETNNRIRMVPTDPDTGPIERSDLVKGYEVSKDEYVLFDDEDFEKVRLESTRTIDIGQFVDEDDIDRLYWASPYYLVPNGDIAAEPYAVIREAMAATPKAVRLGGQGAPLAPFFHHACARFIGADAPLAFLNLGGVVGEPEGDGLRPDRLQGPL